MDMTILHRRDLILGVKKRWDAQYHLIFGRELMGGETAGEISARLGALDLNSASSEDVALIIGNSGWADLTCDFCHTNVETLLRLGQEPDYEARYVEICADCLAKASKVLE